MFRPARETKLAHTHKHPIDEKGRAEKQRKEGGKGERESTGCGESGCVKETVRVSIGGEAFARFVCTVPLFGSVRLKIAVAAEPGDQIRSGKKRWIQKRLTILSM